jgi:peptidoglycan-associated lipoprotein
MNKTLAAIPLALLLAACGSTEKKEAAPVAERTQQPVQTASTAPTSPTTAPSTSTRVDPLNAPGSILLQRSVYFDYDSNVVKDEFRNLVQAHSKYLVENNANRIALEGNTDERGSREYNLALGQRRAEAVKKVMTVLGVPEARIETVSFGEEKPKSNGHDEAAWSQNRRADIVYKGR